MQLYIQLPLVFWSKAYLLDCALVGDTSAAGAVQLNPCSQNLLLLGPDRRRKKSDICNILQVSLSQF